MSQRQCSTAGCAFFRVTPMGKACRCDKANRAFGRADAGLDVPLWCPREAERKSRQMALFQAQAEAPDRLDEAAAMRRMRAAEGPALQDADVALCPVCCGAGEVTAPDGDVCRCGCCQGTGED